MMNFLRRLDFFPMNGVPWFTKVYFILVSGATVLSCIVEKGSVTVSLMRCF